MSRRLPQIALFAASLLLPSLHAQAQQNRHGAGAPPRASGGYDTRGRPPAAGAPARGYGRAPYAPVYGSPAPYGGAPVYGAPIPYGVPPPYAPAPYRRPNSLGADWRLQQEEARSGVRQGQLTPLSRVIEGLQRRTPGRQLDTGIEYDGGRTVYRVRWMTTHGRRVDFLVDAATGAILGER